MRKLLVPLLAVVSLAAVGAAGAASKTVTISNTGYTPTAVSITTGDSVVFKNADSVFKQKVPPFNEEACEETSSPAGKGAHDKYTAAAAKLIAKGTCPPCLDSAAEHEALATADLGVAESKNDKPYPCE